MGLAQGNGVSLPPAALVADQGMGQIEEIPVFGYPPGYLHPGYLIINLHVEKTDLMLPVMIANHGGAADKYWRPLTWSQERTE